MKVVIQRVVSASVTVDKVVIASIGRGILVLTGVGADDTKKDAESLASKVLKTKLWPDDSGAGWKRSVMDIEGEVLCVSQFTLLAETKKGNKPDFRRAAKPEVARELYQHFLEKIKAFYSPDKVKDGLFQAMMEVKLVNDGPVTIDIDTNPPKMGPITGLSSSGTQTPSTQTPATSESSQIDPELAKLVEQLPKELLD